MDRRNFVRASAAAGITLGLADHVDAHQQEPVPAAIRALKPMTAGVKPITDEERLARMEKARRLMRENRIDAVFLESGTSMRYFVNTTFNYPTMAEAYRVAALNGLNRLCD